MVSTDPLPGLSRPRDSAPAAYLIRIVQSHRLVPFEPLILPLSRVDKLTLGRGDRDRLDSGNPTAPTLTLDDPCLSNRHARLVVVRTGPEPVYLFKDLNSTNGTRVNGVAVLQPHPLVHGDVIEIGQSFWKFWHRSGLGFTGLRRRASLAGQLTVVSSVCPELLAMFEQLERVAPTDIPLLIQGESGTGKELVAAEVHRLSGRSGVYQAVNCAAVPEGLFESELFGHRKGAFSGATADHRGIILSAEGGTLLLDEVGDIPLAVQVKLLRVLQEKKLIAVGRVEGVDLNVRFLATTHQDLLHMVDIDLFRGDLYARLAGLVVHLPPLRNRKEDLGILLARLLNTLERPVILSHEAIRAIIEHDWPFNIRGLAKSLTTASALVRGVEEIAPEHLLITGRTVGGVTNDASFRDDLPDPSAPVAARRRPRVIRPEGDELRKALILALTELGGNVSAAAPRLQATRTQLYRWMKRWDIDPNDYRPVDDSRPRRR